LLKKHRGERKTREIEDIPIADVLAIYLDDNVDPDLEEHEKDAKARHLEQTIDRLNNYWGDKKLTDINTKESKAYLKHRQKHGGGAGVLGAILRSCEQPLTTTALRTCTTGRSACGCRIRASLVSAGLRATRRPR
jgi:hypothetical protein